MSEVDSFFVTLTQHTPHVDNLAEKLYRKQFLSTREHVSNKYHYKLFVENVIIIDAVLRLIYNRPTTPGHNI